MLSEYHSKELPFALKIPKRHLCSVLYGKYVYFLYSLILIRT